jgi:hypothetical protein
MKFGKLITPDDPEEMVVWKTSTKVARRINGVAGAPLLQFIVRYFESSIPLDGRAEHGPTIGRGRLNFLRFERSLSGRNQKQPIQSMLFVGILRRNEMAKVYGVEASPKKTNFHKPATMSASAPMEQGRVF